MSDPLRHEWISALFIVALSKFTVKNDEDILSFLMNGSFDVTGIIHIIQDVGIEEKPFLHIPDFFFCIIWLVLSHHRIPGCEDKKLWKGHPIDSLASLKAVINHTWGYWNGKDTAPCFVFQKGTIFSSEDWIRQIKKWAEKVKNILPLFQQIIQEGTLRPILSYSRLCLMYGDHLYSSLDAVSHYEKSSDLYANTDQKNVLKQHLDEHILGVEREALSMAHLLPRFEQDLDVAKDIRSLKKKAPPGSLYRWQDTAVEKIRAWRQLNFSDDIDSTYGFFVVNIASTGCGKTYANAKIMQSLSKDGQSLRFCLALGLRTLTLQTGDEYRMRIGLDDTELAVLIGSKAVEELHRESFNEEISESAEPLLAGEIEYDSAIPESKLSAILKDEKSRKLLYSPVLACTIDYLMMATEAIRGGKWMLPFLRLMSSDLVIDEIDDFTGADIIAIARLIHLAGMLGRKVMISSATIPQDMAEGYFRVYLDGWQMYCKTRKLPVIVGCGWVDEFNTAVHSIKAQTIDACCAEYRMKHISFVKSRIRKIEDNEISNGIRRKGYVVSCSQLLSVEGINERKNGYYEIIKNEIIVQHGRHSYPDPITDIKVSFGCIRVANINPCIELTKYLLDAEYGSETAVRIMAYHSRQVLLLRSEQEKHLDSVMKCNDQSRTKAFSNPIIRNHLDSCKATHLIFIVVCTPVEEVGRDHDFDWAIIEPSSFRSIVQLAGRVRRHRTEPTKNLNIGIMQFNIKGLEDKKDEPVFCMPGFESHSCILGTHDISQLLDETLLGRTINASQRILKSETLDPKMNLIDLEHYVLENQLTTYFLHGPESIEGWIGRSYWWMSNLPQKINRFRATSEPLITLVFYCEDGEKPVFMKMENGLIPQELMLDISPTFITANSEQRFWIKRDFVPNLERIQEEKGGLLTKISLRYGEIQIPEGKHGFEYSDQFGMKKK